MGIGLTPPHIAPSDSTPQASSPWAWILWCLWLWVKPPYQNEFIPRVYGGWVCCIDFMHHMVETPSKRLYPDRSGSILVELSNRLYDSGPQSKSKIRIGYLGSKFGSKSGSWIQVEADPRQKGTGVRECVESVFGASKNRKSKMLRMKFWTSENLVEKWSKRPQDHHNRIRLEKLCPKVVSDPQNAGRMSSKRRFLHFRPIIENPGLNVNFSP